MLNINHQLSPCTTQLAFYNQCFEVLLLLAGTCLFYIVNKLDKEVVFRCKTMLQYLYIGFKRN